MIMCDDKYDFGSQVNTIVKNILYANKPDKTLRDALVDFDYPSGKLIVISIGKAGFQMAKVAFDLLGDKIDDGIVITKYGHSEGSIGKLKIREAAHPIPDEATFSATQQVMELVNDLKANDKVLFLISGGGSSLFEIPLIDYERLKYITDKLIKSGANIDEINAVRKHLSAVKGGRFAKLCAPAKMEVLILSDVISGRLDVIASGPACADNSTSSDALKVLSRYSIQITDKEKQVINKETPKNIDNVNTKIIGSVKELCQSAIAEVEKLGYRAIFLTDTLSAEAKEVGTFLGNIARAHMNDKQDIAFICGGETVVHVNGNGKGGRNTELILSACIAIKGIDNVAIFSLGSDGTDGVTDAAGGIVTGQTYYKIAATGKSVEQYLKNNDSYTALKLANALIKTGPTGTNVNDVAIVLVKAKR